MEIDIDARVVELIDLVKNTYDGKSFDIAKLAQLFTLDVLSTVAFGAPFGYIKANKDLYGYAEASEAFLGPLELLNNHRFFRRLMGNRYVSKLLAPKDSDGFGIGRVLGIARQSVAERFGPDRKEKHDMLGSFVTKGMDQVQCEVEANLQIIAGSDSTTTIFRCTLFQLTANPAAYAKLRSEIDAAMEAGEVSFPVITYAEAQKLSYLQACIWEGIRMWPPLFGMKAKVAPRGGDTIKDMFFPEGTEIAVCDAALCRNKKVFGEDSHVFRPDRWIEADPETRQKYQYVVESIFGTGRYTCLGKHIAMVELHKVFTEVSPPSELRHSQRLT
jgi:cytochrome P450